jgi:hypothetical protein
VASAIATMPPKDTPRGGRPKRAKVHGSGLHAMSWSGLERDRADRVEIRAEAAEADRRATAGRADAAVADRRAERARAEAAEGRAHRAEDRADALRTRLDAAEQAQRAAQAAVIAQARPSAPPARAGAGCGRRCGVGSLCPCCGTVPGSVCDLCQPQRRRRARQGSIRRWRGRRPASAPSR